MWRSKSIFSFRGLYKVEQIITSIIIYSTCNVRTCGHGLAISDPSVMVLFFFLPEINI